MKIVTLDTVKEHPALSRAGCSLKKPTYGKEFDAVLSYVEKGFPKEPDCDLCVFIEPSLGSTYPDLILVYLNKKKTKQWHKGRADLDVRHLNFIADVASRRSVKLTDINREFKRRWRRSWFTTKRSLNKEIKYLSGLGIINLLEGNLLKVDVERNFAASKIIAIEAKRKKWKKGLQQACVHNSYASESYLWMVDGMYKQEELKKYAKLYGVGVLLDDEEYNTPTLVSPVLSIPNSRSSWLLNHWAWLVINS